MPPRGGKGIGSGLQPGSVSPSTEPLAGELGKLDTPGASGASDPSGPSPDGSRRKVDSDTEMAPVPKR